MSFEDDMIEYGFTDGNDYMDYLMDESERMYEKQEEDNRRAEEYEAWLDGGVSKCAPPFFYAQSPDFHKLGLCYYLKISYF